MESENYQQPDLPTNSDIVSCEDNQLEEFTLPDDPREEKKFDSRTNQVFPKDEQKVKKQTGKLLLKSTKINKGKERRDRFKESMNLDIELLKLANPASLPVKAVAANTMAVPEKVAAPE